MNRDASVIDMEQRSTFAARFWEQVDDIRRSVFTSDDLELLEFLKPAERFEERLARLA